MANMSYCMWDNTANDLAQCFNSISEVNNFAEWFENLSSYEQQGFRNVMSMMQMAQREVIPDIEAAGIEF